jgi:peptidylprolyl isomerase
MRFKYGLIAMGLGLMVMTYQAQAQTQLPEKPKWVTPTTILEASPAKAWKDIPVEELLVMTLSDGSKVIIQLSKRFTPEHVRNVRILASTKWWDGSAIIRVQENYVVQWGWPNEPEPKLPEGVTVNPPSEYDQAFDKKAFKPLPYEDSYAKMVGFVDGWPVATDTRRQWPIHCYGMMGVARGLKPDTGSGTQLYVVSGHAPRNLDRNLAIAGRVISGISNLTARPRGKEALGFYKTESERTKIISLRLATDLPAADQPQFQILDTQSQSFDQWVLARANRQDDFFEVPAKAVDICNALVPIRPKP